ncbi:hypothetical protein JW962_00925 [Candidatus Dojkabacteria bacterium]|nr:hypothetical protein [Candidatus Dojkabacteria bacterium]
MKFSQILKRAIEHIKTTKWLAMASVGVITLTFTISGIIFFLVSGLNRSVNEFASRPRIYLYFVPSTEEAQILEIKDIILADSKVESVEYDSQEKAMEELKKRLGTSAETRIVDLTALLPPRLTIKSANLDLVEPTVTFIAELVESNPYVDEIRYSWDSIENLRAISKLLSINGVALIVLSVLATGLLVFVSVNFNVKYFHDELKVANYLGGEQNALILPFVVEGVLYGLAGGIFAGLLSFVFSYGNLELVLQNSVLRLFMERNHFVSGELVRASWTDIVLGIGKNIALYSAFAVLLTVVSSMVAVYTNIYLMRKNEKTK